MSYRAFKRLLGETSLERKCRFLFGAGILVLITLSFWIYAMQTEGLAYDQARTTCRQLVNSILGRYHLSLLEANPDWTDANGKTFAAWAKEWGRQLQESLDVADKRRLKELNQEYQYVILNQSKVVDTYEQDRFKEFRDDETKYESSRLRPNEQVLMYYAPIRMSQSCLSC